VINIFWGLGAGLEYSISQNNALVGGIYYQNGFFDFIRDEGFWAIDNPDKDINDPATYYLKPTEDSRAQVGNLVLRLGILF